MSDKPERRLLSRLPSGRWRVEIDKRIKRDNGVVERVRLRRVLPPATTEQEAIAIAQKIEADALSRAHAIAPSEGWEDYVKLMSESPKSWIYAAMMNMRQRAKTRGIECNLTVGQLRQLLLRSRGRCELTGLRFSTDWQGSARTRPYFHSVDRVDSSGGYTLDNVRLVAYCVNVAMNAWGERVFEQIACGYVFNKYSAFHALRDLK